MRLMLLRHAKTEKAEGGMSDHARRLNARGKTDAPVIGQRIVAVPVLHPVGQLT